MFWPKDGEKDAPLWLSARTKTRLPSMSSTTPLRQYVGFGVSLWCMRHDESRDQAGRKHVVVIFQVEGLLGIESKFRLVWVE